MANQTWLIEVSGLGKEYFAGIYRIKDDGGEAFRGVGQLADKNNKLVKHYKTRGNAERSAEKLRKEFGSEGYSFKVVEDDHD